MTKNSKPNFRHWVFQLRQPTMLSMYTPSQPKLLFSCFS